MDRSTWLITGASSGLGYALAEYVLEQGDQVVAAARTLGPMAALTERYPDAGLALTLDVTDPQQRADAISQAEARFGAINILVNNAGIDFIGAIEEQEEKDYRAQFEVNFFAAAALLRQVLPGMRARGRGTIVNISSMDGIASLPVNGWYASSKFALEGLTEALWQELEPIGLRAFLVEPGSFRTGLRRAPSSPARRSMTTRQPQERSGRCSRQSPPRCGPATPPVPPPRSTTSSTQAKPVTG